MSKKTAFITGGSGGLGSRASLYLVEKGWNVYAADNNEDTLSRLEGCKNISPLFIDVTKQASIDNAFQVVKERTEGLDGIVNFAGVFSPGSLIEISEDTLYQVLNVNVMGTFRVNKTFFPLIQKREGRIINISSEVGRQSGGPFAGAYVMSKHAVEAYSDSLRRELMLLDIRVIKIQPGPFQSDMTKNLESDFTKAANESNYFKSLLDRLKDLVKEESHKAKDPLILAHVIYEALTTPNPKPAYSVKPDRQRELMELLPTRIHDKLLAKVLKG
jgi:NAD(P)-dependent dehydrogenase (short-subunit alcohol dehydrogenase family)